MRKLLKNRKAVSPVIATVLMMLVTMAGMTVLFAFVSSYSENYKAGIGSSVMESITVEDIWLKVTNDPPSYTKEVQISVYNVGKVDSIISSIYVDGLASKYVDGSTNLKAPVEIGAHVSITVYGTQPQNWVSGQTYTFKISTQSGSTFKVDYEAP